MVKLSIGIPFSSGTATHYTINAKTAFMVDFAHGFAKEFCETPFHRNRRGIISCGYYNGEILDRLLQLIT